MTELSDIDFELIIKTCKLKLGSSNNLYIIDHILGVALCPELNLSRKVLCALHDLGYKTKSGQKNWHQFRNVNFPDLDEKIKKIRTSVFPKSKYESI